jgi:hypothetical protein
MRRIVVRDKVFCMLHDNGDVTSSDSTFIDAVILNTSHHPSRMYYDEGRYQCWSIDGVKPDREVNNKQNATCIGCTKNISGSGDGGSRACRYQKQLAIVLANNMEGNIFQLTLSSMSIFGKAVSNKMPLDAYKKYMKSHGVGLESVVTEIRLDDDYDFPKLLFFPKRPLEEYEHNRCVKRIEEKDSSDATKIHFISHKDNIEEKDLILKDSSNFSTISQAMGMTADIN